MRSHRGTRTCGSPRLLGTAWPYSPRHRAVCNQGKKNDDHEKLYFKVRDCGRVGLAQPAGDRASERSAGPGRAPNHERARSRRTQHDGSGKDGPTLLIAERVKTSTRDSLSVELMFFKNYFQLI